LSVIDRGDIVALDIDGTIGTRLVLECGFAEIEPARGRQRIRVRESRENDKQQDGSEELHSDRLRMGITDDAFLIKNLHFEGEKISGLGSPGSGLDSHFFTHFLLWGISIGIAIGCVYWRRTLKLKRGCPVATITGQNTAETGGILDRHGRESNLKNR
jgi:hypothetical protein